MKNILIVIFLGVIFGGCGPQNWQQYQSHNAQVNADAYAEKRAMAIDSFKKLFPETWEQKLLEYDLQQEAIRNQQRILCLQNELRRQNQNRNLAEMFRNMGDAYERQLDRYYSRPPVIFSPSRKSNYNPNFWQEQNAQRQYWENFRKNPYRK